RLRTYANCTRIAASALSIHPPADCPPPPVTYCAPTPPPLTSPLFPYTTLFRSCVARLVCEYFSDPEIWSVHADLNRRQLHISGSDRKSTRLNSSHVSISYAVFCLKKKKNHGVYTCGDSGGGEVGVLHDEAFDTR